MEQQTNQRNEKQNQKNSTRQNSLQKSTESLNAGARPSISDETHLPKTHSNSPSLHPDQTRTGVEEYQFDDSDVDDSRNVEAEGNPAIPVQPRSTSATQYPSQHSRQ